MNAPASDDDLEIIARIDAWPSGGLTLLAAFFCYCAADCTVKSDFHWLNVLGSLPFAAFGLWCLFAAIENYRRRGQIHSVVRAAGGTLHWSSVAPSRSESVALADIVHFDLSIVDGASAVLTLRDGSLRRMDVSIDYRRLVRFLRQQTDAAILVNNRPLEKSKWFLEDVE